MNGLEQEVLKRIVPSPETVASIQDRASRLKAEVESYVASHGLDVEARFTGSFSKNTYLSDPDLDLFLLFPEDTDPEELKRVGLKAGEDILHGIRMYSDHPYTRGVYEGLDVDMVPCFHIKSTEHMKSAVDRTPFHTQFIRSHLTDDGCDQVRLLKKFMKGIGAYGAEQDSRGFSGYLCEILVVRFGSFDGVLQAASHWRNGTRIEVDGKGPDFDAPLVVYDPVDNKRNAASAVHVDTLSLFITAARAYLAEPRMEFFFPDPLAPKSREWLASATESRGTRLVSVSFPRPGGLIEDNLQSQLWKTQYALGRKLCEQGFAVVRAVHSMTESRMDIVFELEADSLSATRKHRGPPAWADSEGFLKKWRGNPYGEPFIEDGAWTVVAPRQYTEAVAMLEKEAVRSGMGKDMDPTAMTVLGHGDTLEMADQSLLTELLDPRMPWER